ncbi:unnamed protein product [Ixodes persulcatus]
MADKFNRLEQHRLQTLTQRYLAAFEDPSAEFPLALLNACSLNAHAKDIQRDVILTKANVLCFTETWNAATPYIRGFDAVMCIEKAERSAGGVAIYVKLPENAVDLELPLTSQSQNGEHAAIQLSDGTIVMTMYLAPNLSRGNVVKYIDLAMRDYEAKYQNNPFVLVGDFNVDITDDDWLVQHMMSRSLTTTSNQ